MVNLAISTGVIASEWKDARVTPIFKSGARNDENNYRPISVLPLVSKVMEHAIQVQFLAFLTVHDLLSIHQSGFRKKHSTETAVVYLTDHILDHMDRQMTTGAVFIDLEKAFDLVDHECLLYKLEQSRSQRWHSGLVPGVPYDTNTKGTFWKGLVLQPSYPFWCSAGLNSRASSLLFYT